VILISDEALNYKRPTFGDICIVTNEGLVLGKQDSGPVLDSIIPVQLVYVNEKGKTNKTFSMVELVAEEMKSGSQRRLVQEWTVPRT
jgi:hypothetical protein